MALSESNYFTYNTPVSPLTIASDGTALTHLLFGTHRFAGKHRPNKLTNNAANQLQEYFAGKRIEFDLPINPHGSEFQQRVWHEIQNIPYGETTSYKQIAEKIGIEKASHAVGAANNKNPLRIIVPCHRVIGSNGKPVGNFAELRTKSFLLSLEKEYRK